MGFGFGCEIVTPVPDGVAVVMDWGTRPPAVSDAYVPAPGFTTASLEPGVSPPTRLVTATAVPLLALVRKVCTGTQVMQAAKAKYGPDYHVAGVDGIHPAPNGHLVMAYAFLKALGCSGEIGTFTWDARSGTATATEGHKITSTGKGIIEIIRQKKVLTEKQIAELLDPVKLTNLDPSKYKL